jgi:hypothetical protein
MKFTWPGMTLKLPRSIWTCRDGSLVVPFALCLPVLVMICGGAIDYAVVTNQRLRLQAAVDAAALAGARELGLSDARRENVAASVEAMVRAAMTGSAAERSASGSPLVMTLVRDEPLEVEISARQTTTPIFGDMIGIAPEAIEVSTVARIVGRPNICVLGLDKSAGGTISLEKNARVTGQNCAVYSNSTHRNSIASKNSAVLSASLICAAGGREGAPGNFTPEPLTDCPTFDDPLGSRPEPAIEPCSDTKPKLVKASTFLTPGTYCGGLRIEAGATVDLDAGIYVIKDGPLEVSDGASLIGKGVGFFLTGADATLNFKAASSIDLAAPRSGEMAGMLVFEGRSQPTTGVHEIRSDNAGNLLGTIYLSRGRLHVDANSPIADKSAYTAIVARMLTLYGGPHLVLNSNYEQTDVPVPEGIRGAAQPVSIVR